MTRPIKNPQSYLMLIEMKYVTDTDLNELIAILGSTDVNPSAAKSGIASEGLPA